VIGVRGYALPDGEPVELYADGDRWTTDPVPGAEVVAGGWIIPGLVDVHTHPGAERPDLPLSEAALREDLERHLRAGVTAIRSPGLAGDPPAWFGTDPDLPRAWHAGRWLAPEGGFFEGGGRQVPLARLPELAASQAAATGWAKLVGDWTDPVPAATIAETARRVRAVGGRIAVHCQDPDSCRAAVAAGVDSIEHGQHLDPSLLDRMAAGDIALVPTLAAFQATVPEVAAREPSERRDRWLAGTAAMGPTAAAAHEAGVRVLAGTDAPDRHGRVAAEVRALAEAGLPGHADLGVLDHPVRVILRGRVVA
jgi:predicted amidohydrolase YtcJ